MEKDNDKYRYVTSSEVAELKKMCDQIINELQNSIRDYFTFDPRLVGSGEKRLVTYSILDKTFDLDYNIIIQKDKKNLLSNPKKIKELFIRKLNEINPKYKFSFAENSKSVITSRLKTNTNNYNFYFDLAIMHEGNNGNMQKLVYDKPDRYIWNEIKDTKDYQRKFKRLKDEKKFMEIKKRYLKKKNDKKYSNVSSFSLFVETINELYDGKKNDR